MEAVWHDVWWAVQADFSDLPGVVEVTQLVLRMLLAALLGGILGYQRERQGKEAGPNRVIILWVCAILDEGGLWHHRRGIISREISMPL